MSFGEKPAPERPERPLGPAKGESGSSERKSPPLLGIFRVRPKPERTVRIGVNGGAKGNHRKSYNYNQPTGIC